MIVIALDVDGTLESSNGPVETRQLMNLLIIDLCKVEIVSPSSAYPKNDDGTSVFSRRYVVETSRVDALRSVKAAFPRGAWYVYVSDNPGDDQVAREAGFTYIHSRDWR